MNLKVIIKGLICSLTILGLSDLRTMDPWSTTAPQREMEASFRSLSQAELNDLEKSTRKKIEHIDKNIEKLKQILTTSKYNENTLKEIDAWRDMRKSEQNKLSRIQKFIRQKAIEPFLSSEAPIYQTLLAWKGILRKIEREESYKDQFLQNLSTYLTPEEKNRIIEKLNTPIEVVIAMEEKEQKEQAAAKKQAEVRQQEEAKSFVDLAKANNKSPFDGVLGEPGTDLSKPITNRIEKFNDLFQVRQKPSLCQRRTKSEQTNLCGYYAIFNARELASERDPVNRNKFVQNFATMLQFIAKERKLKAPYSIDEFDNLSDEEIIKLLKEQNLINKILLIDQNLFNAIDGGTSLNSLPEFGFDEQQIKIFKDFVTNESDEILLIYLVPVGTNHYITIKVERSLVKKENFLTFYIYDSLGKNYLEQHMIENRILPLYRMLTTKINK